MKMANEPMTPKELLASKQAAITPPKTVRIIIEENDAIPPTGLFIGLNGRGYLVQAGVEVNVPAALIETVIQVVEMLFGLGNLTVEALDRLTLDLPVQ